MANNHTYELLLDSEANLRLIGNVLSDDIRDLDGELSAPALRMLPVAEDGLRGHAGADVQVDDPVARHLSGSRAMLEETARQLTAAGDTDALDRILSLIDEMESTEPAEAAAFAATARAAIRGELRTLALRLQAQDDSARQIERANALLGEIADRLQTPSRPDGAAH